MRKRFSLSSVLVAIIITIASIAYSSSTYITSVSVPVSAGGNHSGTSTTCMVMSDSTAWSGGASGLQGAYGTNMSCGNSLAANVALKFNVGSTVAALNAQHPGWVLANPKLAFQYTLYANNSRFNGGNGDFNIYWVSNDGWSNSGTTPVYASSPAGFSGWATYALLTSSVISYPWETVYIYGAINGYYGNPSDCGTGTWTTDKTGYKQAVITYNLDETQSSFVNDITNATNGGANDNVSLYLMPTSPASSNLGLTIFTGGGTTLPTLSFDVYSTSKP